MARVNIFGELVSEGEPAVVNDGGDANAPNGDIPESMEIEEETQAEPVTNSKEPIGSNSSEVANNVRPIVLRKFPSPHSAPELTPDILHRIETEFNSRKEDDPVCRYKGSNWLDDSTIDQYLKLIKSRNEQNGTYPTIYSFQCTFYTLLKNKHLKDSGYATVAAYANTENIFSYDLVLFPCEINKHWRLVVMDLPAKTLLLYDSLCGEAENTRCLKNIGFYLKREYERVERMRAMAELQEAQEGNPALDEAEIVTQRKKMERDLNKRVKTFFDANIWTVKIVDPLDIPRQANSFDCGVFILQYAEYLSRRRTFDFTQVHASYFRLKMAFETFTGELMIV